MQMPYAHLHTHILCCASVRTRMWVCMRACVRVCNQNKTMNEKQANTGQWRPQQKDLSGLNTHACLSWCLQRLTNNRRECKQLFHLKLFTSGEFETTPPSPSPCPQFTRPYPLARLSFALYFLLPLHPPCTSQHLPVTRRCRQMWSPIALLQLQPLTPHSGSQIRTQKSKQSSSPKEAHVILRGLNEVL